MLKFDNVLCVAVFLWFSLQIREIESRNVPASVTADLIVDHFQSENTVNYQLIRDHVEIMKKAMNFDVNPCENFTKFACGNYVQDMYGIGIYPNIASENYVELAFQDDTKLFEAAAKARNFYVSCKTKKTKLYENLENLNSLKQHEIHWPILEKQWHKNNTAWMKLSEDIKLLGGSSILEFNKVNNDMLQISFGREFTAMPSFDKNEILDMIKTVQDFSGIDYQEAKIVVDEIILFTKSRYEAFNTIGTNCARCGTALESYSMTLDVKSLKKNFANINWNMYLEMVFQRQVNDFEIVQIKHYLRTIPYLEFLSNTNHRVLTNYLIWKLIKELKKYDEHEHDDCAMKTFSNFESVMPALYAQVLFDDFNRRQYLDIFKRFKDSFEFSKCHYDATNIRDLEPIFKTDIEHIRNLEILFAINRINENFQNVTINPNNYYQNLINLGKHENCKFHDKECVKRVHLMVFIFEISSLYNKPTYYNFVDKYFAMWESVIRNAFLRGWNSIQFENSIVCATQQANEYGIDSDTTQSIILGATLKQVYNDYKKWLIENEDLEREQILNKIGLSTKKAFFVNFAQAYCNQELKQRDTILQSLINMEEFGKEFKCSHEATMNPSLRCRVS